MRQLYYVIRTLLRGRGSNLIKIISLGLGLTMSILLFARVAFEQSFDKCYKDYDNLYQVFSIFTVNGEKSEPQDMNYGPVAGAILDNFPEEVEAATSICKWAASLPLYNGSVRFDDNKIMADSLFFQTMGIEVLSGNPRDLMQKDVIFLSDRLATKIFGGENPVGKVLRYNKSMEMTVKGTYAALPENTTLRPEAVISMPSMWSRDIGNYSWNGGDSYFEYIRFRPGADKEAVFARLDGMIQKYLPKEGEGMYGYTAMVKPIRDVYRNYDEVKRMKSIMSILGFVILFIAGLNYVLISISSLAYRAKSVGVHKSSGASGGKVFGMFLLETGIIILLALLLMLLILVNFREFFEDTTAAKLESLFAFDRLWVPLFTVFLLFLVGGILPGRMFARIPVSQVFHRYTEGKKGWKRPLLFIQFAGVTFICGLMCVVMVQYKYVLNKDTGYNPKQVVYSYSTFGGTSEDSNYARQFFKGLPYVESVSSASYPPCIGFSGMMIQNEGGQALFSSRFCEEEENYPAMMGMKMKQGRMAREKDEVVVNENFAERMRWGNEIVGRMVHAEGSTYKVVGVLKDFRTNSFYNEQEPLIVHCYRNFGNCIHVRLKEPFAENLRKLNEESSEAFPDKTVSFRSLEQSMEENYNALRVFRNATLMATIAMFFVMLMGLIGYTADEVRRRSKEIAIRKVNGAEASGILELLSKDVLYVALPATVIGSVASWYVNTMWMDMFAEHVPLNWMVYVWVVIGVLIVIVACVVWKAWRIANENPVNSIKSE